MRLFFTALYILYLALALVASLIPDFLEMGYQTDKMLHITVVCVALIWPCLFFSNWRMIFIFAGALLVGGVCIEILQTFTPDRKAELGDVLANCIGVVLGLIIGGLMRSGVYADVGGTLNKRNLQRP